MKTPLFFIFLLLCCCSIAAQEIKVSGKVIDESQYPVNNVLVVDLFNDNKVQTNANGEFTIVTNPNSTLRFVVKFLKRKDVALKTINITQDIIIVMEPEPIAIDPVEIGFKPSLNLKKDAKALEESKKLVALKNDLNLYMKSPMTTVVPKSTVPSNFSGLDFRTGTLDLKGVATALAGLLRKAKGNTPTKANYAEKEAFKKRMIETINLDFIKIYGLDDYDVELFLSVADDSLQLSKKYRNNYNKNAVESELKSFLQEYLKKTKIKK